ncbi:MAG: hypothetical protein Q4E24_12040 [bacterium]|nr:hypothetical protein [bacterium]
MRNISITVKMRKMSDIYFNICFTWVNHGSSLPSGELFVDMLS